MLPYNLGLFLLILCSVSYIFFLKMSGKVILMPLEDRSSTESDKSHPNGPNESFQGGVHVEVAEKEDPDLDVCQRVATLWVILIMYH